MRHLGLLAVLTAALTIGCADKDTTGSGTDSGLTTAGCDDPATWYVDGDSDGFGLESDSVVACDAPAGFVAQAGDCDDGDGAVNPDADELCDDVDNDCNDAIDDEPLDPLAYYTDSDSDGYGDATTQAFGCDVPSGAVKNDRDCDDDDSAVFPGAEEVCDFVDQDCDDQVDEDAAGATEYHPDADSDGYGDAAQSSWACDDPPEGYTLDGSDCNDAVAAINPDGQETCDGSFDEDCDGQVDEADATNTTAFYADKDVDGFGDPTDSVDACTAPSGYGVDNTDCDDTDASEYPGASWYADGDGDSYGDPGSVTACERGSASDVATNDDCDDTDSTVHPSAAELCDGQLNDCLGSGVPSDEVDGDGDGYVSCTVDVGGWDGSGVAGGDDCDDADATESPGVTWYADSDGDGFGDGSSSSACERAAASDVGDASDCDDGDSGVNPGASEVCDSADQDCDGTVDEGVTDTYYRDNDGDGYGSPSASTDACSVPSGYAENSQDCDDGDSGVNPAQTEVCDGTVDEDCDGDVDEGLTSTYYRDFDSDGYGSATSSTSACSVPSGYVSDSSDCNDTASGVNPGATEVCDGTVDEDCDGGVDEGVETTFYRDGDSDTYGDPSDTWDRCTQPSGYVTDGTDCDDTDGEVNPGAAEVCDGVDTDCDASTGEDGLAAFTNAGSGATTDVTASMTPSGAAPVATYAMSTAGELAICDGTWDAALVIKANVSVYGMSGDRDKVVLDGGGSARPVTVDKNGITVSLEDLTLTNGYATDDQLAIGSTSGGAIACDGTGTSLTGANLAIEDSYAYFGGAVSSADCSLEFTDTDIEGNTAVYGAAMFVEGTDLVMSDSTITGGAASYYGGAFYLYDGYGAVSVDLTDTLVSGNDALYYAGGIYAYASSANIDVRCTGSAGSAAGFTKNTASYDGGGLYLGGSALTFDASNCDFGTDAGGDLNDPMAIYGGGWDYEPGDDATFTCDGYGCGTETINDIGDDSNSFGATSTAWWNIFEGTGPATLASFTTSLRSSTASCTVTNYVLSAATSSSGTVWDHEWSGSTTLSKSTSFSALSSGSINLPIQEGRFYALVAASSCSYSVEVQYGYGMTAGADVGFGELVGAYYDYGAYVAATYSGGSATSSSPSSYIWSQTATVHELE